MAGVQPEIIVNEKSLGVSWPGTVLYRDALPGRYLLFATSDPDEQLEMTLAEGEEVYVRIAPRLTLTGFRVSPERVEASEAQREVEGLRLIEP